MDPNQSNEDIAQKTQAIIDLLEEAHRLSLYLITVQGQNLLRTKPKIVPVMTATEQMTRSLMSHINETR